MFPEPLYILDYSSTQGFAVAFPTFIETPGGHPGSGDTYDPQGTFYNESVNFKNLFGMTNYWAPSQTAYSLGYYIDEGNVMRMMGIRIRPLNATIYGLDYVGDFTAKADGGDPFYGTYLVRDTAAIPAPAAIWLFGTGIIGLIGISKRRKSA